MKKFVIVGLTLMTLFSNFSLVKAEEKNYTIYNIGDSVTLVDGSKWHVISYSGNDSNELTIFSDYFVKTDGTQYQSWDLGWTSGTGFGLMEEYFGSFDDNSRNNSNNTFCVLKDNENSTYNGCNAYSKVDGTLTRGNHSGTVGDDSYIKKYVETKFLPNFINSLNNKKGITSSINARLITIEEISDIESLNLSQNSVITFGEGEQGLKLISNITTDWLKAYNTNNFAPIAGYYTMSQVFSNDVEDYHRQAEYVYAIAGDGIYATSHLTGEFHQILNGTVGGSIGVRPVVTLNKANVAGSKEYDELNKVPITVDNSTTTTTVQNIQTTKPIENPKTLDIHNSQYIIFVSISIIGICGLMYCFFKKTKKSQ